jgi:hypothetical protein
MGNSEIARIRQQIADEYQAAQLGLYGLAAGTSRHQFITARMERMGEAFTRLTELVGSPQQAMQVVVETLANLPEPEGRA